MILDQIIVFACFIAITLSIFSGAGLVPALLITLSLVINEMALSVVDTTSRIIYFATIDDWAIYVSVKDLLFLTLLGFRQNPRELIILLSFAVSCLFHQAILAQVLTYEAKNLTLFAIRPQVMMYVSVAQLATVFYIILTGSGINGGKRKCAKRNILDFHHNFHRVLHVQAFKVKR